LDKICSQPLVFASSVMYSVKRLSKFLSKGSTGVRVFLAWRGKQSRLPKYRASLKN